MYATTGEKYKKRCFLSISKCEMIMQFLNLLLNVMHGLLL
jgi:hypothetical protein